jgi:hypothetical protein
MDKKESSGNTGGWGKREGRSTTSEMKERRGSVGTILRACDLTLNLKDDNNSVM